MGRPVMPKRQKTLWQLSAAKFPGRAHRELQGGAHMRDGFTIGPLKDQQHSEIRPTIEILRIERNNFAEDRNG